MVGDRERPEPTCSACGQPYWLRNGCTSTFMAHTYLNGAEPIIAELAAEDGVDLADWVGDCGNCAVRPDAHHHLGCSQAYCTGTGAQMLMCDCELCSEANEMGYLVARAERGEIEIDPDAP